MNRCCRLRHLPWRFAPPACLLLALLMFPLPWLQVETGLLLGPPLRSADGSIAGASQADVYPDGSGRTKALARVVTLSGVRMASGPSFVPRTSEKDSGKVIEWSPLMAVCPFLLIGGILLGLGMRPGILRVVAVGTCSILALLLPLGITEYQTFSGYIEIRSTIWMLIALVAMLGSVVVLGAEGWWQLRSNRAVPPPGKGASPNGAASLLGPSAGSPCPVPLLSSRPG